MTTDCTTKTCSRCKQAQDRSCFYKDRHSKDGLCHQCKTCTKAHDVLYRQEHRERIKAYNAMYHASHRDERKEYKHRYYELNQEHQRQKATDWRSKNRSRALHSSRDYIKVHREQYNAHERKRRARKRMVGGTHTADDVIRQGTVQQWRCWWCGESCQEKYHVDHLVPLSRGGHNGPDNIVIACPHCNLSKCDKMPDEWIGRLL